MIRMFIMMLALCNTVSAQGVRMLAVKHKGDEYQFNWLSFLFRVPEVKGENSAYRLWFTSDPSGIWYPHEMIIKPVRASLMEPRIVLADRRMIRMFEGGAVYTAEHNGRFFVVVDESTTLDMLSPEDCEGLSPVQVFEFDSTGERECYIQTCD